MNFTQIVTILQELERISYYNFISNIITITIIAVCILVTVEFIGFIIKRKFSKSRRFPREAVSGLLNFMRVIAIFIMLFSILVNLGIMDYETLLSFSTIFSTAIGLASAIIIGNLIAGFYMIGSRPYSVGDYITIGGTEGFVTEIGLNYTTIRDSVGVGNIHKIPNKVAMGSDLINYKTAYSEYIKDEESKKTTEKIKKTLDKLISRKKISRYNFKMEIELEKNPQKIINILDEVCKRWTSKFGYKPTISYFWISWRLNLRVIIMTEDLENAINLLPDFKEDIWLSIYGKKEESD